MTPAHAFRPDRDASPSQRLAAVLLTERMCEDDFLEKIATLDDLDLLADMVERADRKAFIAGAEAGRREIERKHYEAGCSVNSLRPS